MQMIRGVMAVHLHRPVHRHHGIAHMPAELPPGMVPMRNLYPLAHSADGVRWGPVCLSA
jgi:hypothetical protein